jgi:hypothetical protein
MKTAIQEALIKLRQLRDDCDDYDYKSIYSLAIVTLNEYLEKEKEQIQKAFSDGQETPINHPTLPHYSREEYYDDNYKTETI